MAQESREPGHHLPGSAGFDRYLAICGLRIAGGESLPAGQREPNSREGANLRAGLPVRAAQPRLAGLPKQRVLMHSRELPSDLVHLVTPRHCLPFRGPFVDVGSIGSRGAGDIGGASGYGLDE